MKKEHHYVVTIQWTGNTGTGTSDYRTYERSHRICVSGKTDIEASSDPSFRGDKTRHNPEQLFLSSLSSCHMLWYLHLCADAGVVVLAYKDAAEGLMLEINDGSGYFSEVTLHPHVIVSDVSMIEKANALHEKANRFCFIANSCNFPVKHKPFTEVKTS